MGTWEGHISPGVAFYSFGIVFCFQFSRQFLSEQVFNYADRHKSLRFHMTKGGITTRISKFFHDFPVDAFLKILYGVGAAMAELFYPPGTNKLYLTYPNGKWAHLSEWQHFTMYISFAISGCIDVISHKITTKRLLVIEKAAIGSAFIITSLLLFYHRHGKTELEQEAHELLLYATLCMVGVLLAQMWMPDDPRLLWTQTLVVMVMGSWLFHMAFILFPLDHQPWHEGDPMNEMVLPMFFCWHILFNAAVAGVIFASQYMWYKNKYGTRNYSDINTELGNLTNGSNDEIDDDDDDDVTIFRTGYNT